jgi:predicted transcriptional regulator
MSGSTVFRDVLSSTVRTDVLLAVTEGSRTTAGLKKDVDASESAVYNALGDLERRGLVRSVDGHWEPTGSGQLVTDLVAQGTKLERLVEDGYWMRHDVATLPWGFRLRLPELADADVFRAPDTNPHAVIREVCDRIEAGGPSVDIATPIYQSEYEAVMPDHEEARLLIDRTVLEDALTRIDDLAEAREFGDTHVRVLDIDVALGVTDDHLMLSLPTIDGQYDSRTEVFATDQSAIAWGRDLFDHYWDLATPADQFLPVGPS